VELGARLPQIVTDVPFFLGLGFLTDLRVGIWRSL
jgi:hypothetical protein